jgi:hypothetical protein
VSIFSGGIRSWIFLDSRKPARRTPSVQSTPPITFQMKKERADISNIPATGLRNVRTIGMNLAKTTALAAPNLLK